MSEELKPDPGPGYRLLEAGEVLQEGDEYLDSRFGEWRRTGYRGQQKKASAIYRRKVDPVEKPPLGLAPRYVWAQHRAAEILDAMSRFVAEGRPLPHDWFLELDDRLHEANLVEESANTPVTGE